jgi:hypothetical protein
VLLPGKKLELALSHSSALQTGRWHGLRLRPRQACRPGHRAWPRGGRKKITKNRRTFDICATPPARRRKHVRTSFFFVCAYLGVSR